MKRDDALKLATKGYEELAKALAEGRSETLMRYLGVMGRFHNYSFRNCMMIAMQRPEATQVAGYRKWEQLGRQVKKGETGIGIFAPLVYRKKQDGANNGSKAKDDSKKDAEKRLQGFRVVLCSMYRRRTAKRFLNSPRSAAIRANGWLDSKVSSGPRASNSNTSIRSAAPKACQPAARCRSSKASTRPKFS